MKNSYFFLCFFGILITGCSSYKITNLSSKPLTLSIQYNFNDSLNDQIPLQVKQFNKEVRRGQITNLKTDISGLTGILSFELLSKRSTKVSFLILSVVNENFNKANPNMIIKTTQQSLNPDTVFQVINGTYTTNKFKGKLLNYIAPRRYYRYVRRNAK